MRDERERVLDMLEAIQRIEQHTGGGRAEFDRSELIQNWVLRHLQVIGEAARSLPEEFRARHQTVPWQDIVGMRNVLVHLYFGIDLEVVWSVVERDLPELKQALLAMVGEQGDETPAKPDSA